MLIFFDSRDVLLRLDVDSIVYFEAYSNYTQIVSKNKMKMQVGISLIQMEQQLVEQMKEEASVFMRVGKRFIINRNYVVNINIAKQYLILSDMLHFAFQLPISKDALKKMKDLFIRTRV